MSFTPTQEEVYEFLQNPSRPHGVLGYLDSDEDPESAFVGFSVTPSLDFVFGTSDTSRKFQAVQDDNRVSFNVTDKELRYTVQLKGTVKEIKKDDLAQYEDDHYAKLGEFSRKFKNLPDQHFFIIRPTLLRFSDCSGWPWVVTTIIGES